MRGTLALLASIALAMFCWGVYGPVLREGQLDMAGSSLRPFICVGMAYFLIAVLAPGVVMKVRPEPGHWSTSGIFWSLAAGAVGALGALGIILALSSGGSPVYVMPLVFGCAPVVNTFLTMYWGAIVQASRADLHRRLDPGRAGSRDRAIVATPRPRRRRERSVDAATAH